MWSQVAHLRHRGYWPAVTDRPWAPLLALPLFTLFPWYPALAAMAWSLGEALGSWRWLKIDGAVGEIRARRDAWFLLGRRRVRMAEDLADALGVPWRWAGWEERSVWEDARELALRLWIRARPARAP